MSVSNTRCGGHLQEERMFLWTLTVRESTYAHFATMMILPDFITGHWSIRRQCCWWERLALARPHCARHWRLFEDSACASSTVTSTLRRLICLVATAPPVTAIARLRHFALPMPSWSSTLIFTGCLGLHHIRQRCVVFVVVVVS